MDLYLLPSYKKMKTNNFTKGIVSALKYIEKTISFICRPRIQAGLYLFCTKAAHVDILTNSDMEKIAVQILVDFLEELIYRTSFGSY
jgi:hypothetical protein